MRAQRHERSRFRSVLDRFEREGCNLLVVGETDPPVRRAAARRLFGDADRDRDRVLVAPAEVDAEAWLPGEGRVVHLDADIRRSPAPRAVPLRDLPDRVTFESTDPGRSRLGVTTVEPLIGTTALDELRDTVDRANGIGHYHLTAPVDAVRVRPLSDDFDAIVELQHGPSGARERWHVDDEDLTTGWVTIESLTHD